MPVIRRGEPRDLPAIAAIQSASPEASHWDVAGYLQYDLLVAIEENRVAGFLVSRAVVPGECEVLNLAVAPPCRRRGIGGALVDSLLRGFTGAVFLEVRESNRNAREFYASKLFQEVGRRPEYYDLPSEAAIVMKFHSC